jgi:hypothetical protein
MVPFYNTDSDKIVFMKLEDYRRTGSAVPRLVGCWEVLLDENIQEIYLRYAKENLKLENLLIQFPIAMIYEENCYLTMYWNEQRNETKTKEVTPKSEEILRKARYFERAFVPKENETPN